MGVNNEQDVQKAHCPQTYDHIVNLYINTYKILFICSVADHPNWADEADPLHLYTHFQ